MKKLIRKIMFTILTVALITGCSKSVDIKNEDAINSLKEVSDNFKDDGPYTLIITEEDSKDTQVAGEDTYVYDEEGNSYRKKGLHGFYYKDNKLYQSIYEENDNPMVWITEMLVEYDMKSDIGIAFEDDSMKVGDLEIFKKILDELESQAVSSNEKNGTTSIYYGDIPIYEIEVKGHITVSFNDEYIKISVKNDNGRKQSRVLSKTKDIVVLPDVEIINLDE